MQILLVQVEALVPTSPLARLHSIQRNNQAFCQEVSPDFLGKLLRLHLAAPDPVAQPKSHFR